MMFASSARGNGVRRGIKYAGRTVVFGGAKCLVLLAPLLAASQLGVANYGAAELWLATAMVLAPVVGLGSHGVIAYDTLESPANGGVRAAAVLLASSSVILCLLSLLVIAAGFPQYAPPVLHILVVMLQLGLAARLRSEGKGEYAAVAESSIYIAWAVATALVMIGWPFLDSISLALAVVAAVLATIATLEMPLPRPSTWMGRVIRIHAAAGVRFVFSGLTLGLFMAAPRLTLGFLYSTEVVGQFALAFRIVSAAIIVQRLLSALFFRELFGKRSAVERDRGMAVVVGLVAVTAILVCMLASSGYLSAWVPAAGNLAGSDALFYWVLAACVVLWSTSTCFEGCLYRHKLVREQAMCAIVGVGAFVASFLATLHLHLLTPLVATAGAWAVGFATICVMQFLTMAKNSARLTAMPLACVAGLAVILVTTLTQVL